MLYRRAKCSFSWVLLLSLVISCQTDETLNPNTENDLEKINHWYLHEYQWAYLFNLSREELATKRDEARRLFNSGMEEAELAALFGTGLVEFVDSRSEDALKHHLETLRLSEQLNAKGYTALACVEIARSLNGNGDKEPAIDYQFRANQVFKELGWTKHLAEGYQIIGLYNSRSGQLDSAEQYYFKAIEIHEQLDNQLGKQAALDLLGWLSLKKDGTQKALGYMQEAYEISKSGDPLYMLRALQALAQIQFKAGQVEKGIKSYERALELAKQFGSRDEAFVLRQIGISLLEVNRVNQATSYLERSKSIAHAHHLAFSESLTIRGLVNAYQSQGRYKETVQLMNRLNHLTDSLDFNNQQKELTRLTKSYEEENKDLIIAAQEATISSKTNEQYAWASGIFLLLITSILLGFNYIQKRRSNNAISKQNQIIQSALEERESLLKEIHHRVKNNLQIIASLLYLQSGKFENEDFKKVLEEGQGRVRSMALIHQKLYENEDLKSIPFGEYLVQLVTEIKSSFGSEIAQIDLKIDADDVFFDVETAIPLGLIVNELATNSFKYAFKNQTNGTFNISLRKLSGNYVLTISDDGPGISEEIDIRKAKSLGLRLVRMLSQQLEGNFEINSKNGTQFELNFAA